MSMLKASEVAQILGLSARSVYALADSGMLACYRLGVGRGALRFDQADVDTYRAACRSAGTPATSAGATSSTVSLRVSGTELAACFRAAGVKPRLTHSTEPKARASTPLRLASSEPIRYQHTIGKVLGHLDARSTDRYAHLLGSTLAEAVGKIGRKSPHTAEFAQFAPVLAKIPTHISHDASSIGRG